MPKGGHGRSGPAPDPNALRRDRPSDAAGWTSLPASGREGEPPEWPLADVTAREWGLWELEWSKPQAIMWERNGQFIEVALYVRSLVAAESMEASVAARTLVRQQMDSLGLTIPGLRTHRWKITHDEVGAKRAEKPTPAASSARDRLKLVPRGTDAG